MESRLNITHGYASNIVSFGREREMFRNAYLSNFIRILSIYDVRMDASKRANFFLFFFFCLTKSPLSVQMNGFFALSGHVKILSV